MFGYHEIIEYRDESRNTQTFRKDIKRTEVMNISNVKDIKIRQGLWVW